MMRVMNQKRQNNQASIEKGDLRAPCRCVDELWRTGQSEARKRHTVVENLSLKLVMEIMIEIEALFGRAGTTTIEIVGDTRDV